MTPRTASVLDLVGVAGWLAAVSGVGLLWGYAWALIVGGVSSFALALIASRAK